VFYGAHEQDEGNPVRNVPHESVQPQDRMIHDRCASEHMPALIVLGMSYDDIKSSINHEMATAILPMARL
jgi:hypothetical protein